MGQGREEAQDKGVGKTQDAASSPVSSPGASAVNYASITPAPRSSHISFVALAKVFAEADTILGGKEVLVDTRAFGKKPRSELSRMDKSAVDKI